MEHYINFKRESDFEDFMRDNRDWYYRRCFDKIFENFYGDSESKDVEIMVIHFDENPDTEYVVNIIERDLILNLNYGIAYFEEIEDYEMCANITKLIDDIQVYEYLKEPK